MCDKFSFVITKNGSYYHTATNSHTQIRDRFAIREVGPERQDSWELECWPRDKGEAAEYVDQYDRGLVQMSRKAMKTAYRVYQAIEDLFVEGDTSCFDPDGLFDSPLLYADLIADAYLYGNLEVRKKLLPLTGRGPYLSEEFNFGHIVQVKPDVDTPKYNWGCIRPEDVGYAVELRDHPIEEGVKVLIVNFPGFLPWKADPSEMMKVEA